MSPNNVPSLPYDLTIEEVTEAIEKVVRVLAPSFVFGFYDLEDIQQEARLEGWRVLSKYDPLINEEGKQTRPLANFLYRCIKNRLILLKRDKYRRTEPVCKDCHGAEPGRTGHANGEYCKKYLAWKKRNDSKANLARPLGMAHLEDCEREDGGKGVENVIEGKEIFSLIDRYLPIEHRAVYLMIKSGQRVSKAKKELVMDLIQEIIREHI